MPTGRNTCRRRAPAAHHPINRTWKGSAARHKGYLLGPIGLTVRCMRTTSECLVKAAEMDRRSDACPDAAIAADYEKMARSWRRIARETALEWAFEIY
jgi:hypothetical protein